jgi:hypothetical protein
MFEFVMDDLPKQVLPVDQAEIVLFYNARTDSDVISLSVTVSAAARDVPFTEDGETYDYRIAPTYYTEWLEIPLSKLGTRGADALDGYEMIYEESREAELGFNQFPGAVYQDSHAGFTRATMRLQYTGGNTYRVTAEGETEFGWSFSLTATAPIAKVILRDGREDRKNAPSTKIEAEFATLFDPELFDAGWQKKGSSDYSWFDYVATPREQDQ